MPRIICWYSDGAASALAAGIAIDHFKKDKENEILLVYCATNSEHPSNKKFREQVENWLGYKVTVIESELYSNVDDVIEKTKYLRGINGARCTTELKKLPRYKFQKPDDIHIFGYTYDRKDIKRANNFRENNFDLKLVFPLIQFKISKAQCLNTLKLYKIDIPEMYKLGFNNNNCLGCVKAESPSYWNDIRKNFPIVFNKRAEQERESLISHCVDIKENLCF